MSKSVNNTMMRETIPSINGLHFNKERPAILGGDPMFPEGLPFMRPTIQNWGMHEQPVKEIIESGMLTKGAYLREFEAKTAAYLGVEEVVAVSSCTCGLMLLYQSLGLEGEVIVPSFTFMATVSPLIWRGITPIFVDVDPLTWNVDPEQVEAHITPQTTAIVGVHVFGNPAPIEALEKIAKKHNLQLIFDAAHGFGTLHRKKPVGRHGVAEVFSTSPTKLLVTGEGGVVATNDTELANKIRIAREYGNPGNYDSIVPGINARMQEFSAILGLISLDILENNAHKRNVLASYYQFYVSQISGIDFQLIHSFDRSSYKDFTVQIDAQKFGLSRDQLQVALRQEGVSTRAYYVPPVHQHTAYQDLVAAQKPALPITERLAQSVLSLPIYSHMPSEYLDKVCEAIYRIQRNAQQVRSTFVTATKIEV